MSLVSLLSGRQRWKSAEHVALSISVFLSPFTLLVSVSIFGTIQRGLACPGASVDTHQSRSVVKFYVAQFQRCCDPGVPGPHGWETSPWVLLFLLSASCSLTYAFACSMVFSVQLLLQISISSSFGTNCLRLKLLVYSQNIPGRRLDPGDVTLPLCRWPLPRRHASWSCEASTDIKIILADVHTTCNVKVLLVDSHQFTETTLSNGARPALGIFGDGLQTGCQQKESDK